ncbi:MAG: fused MFS/spermidine synthase [Chloroflexi bacterium]|nr:fused MFS/spermidine synthase [Chloroflexota bacterium]
MTSVKRTLHQRLWNPYIIVFIGSAGSMITELVASRMIAPQIGVSLYTWTSVIGVILAGSSLGNYLGGRLADRYGSPRLLGIVFALASIASLSILPLRELANSIRWGPNFPLLLRVVLYIGIIFILPSLMLGCVSPIVVKISLSNLEHSGSTVGKIYAWATVGSIVGTFATGFWLISLFGTKTIIVLVSAVQMIVGVWFLASAKLKPALIGATAALLIYGCLLGILYWRGMLGSECMRETNYFCINTYDRDQNEDIKAVEGAQYKPLIIRELVLDRLVHSYVDLENPSRLVYGYERTYADVIKPLLARKGMLDSFFIGGGGYTFPRYLELQAPGSELVVAEIDPGVTEVARERLNLPLTTTIKTVNLDARILMETQQQDKAYDLVFGDAFNDYSVPYHLTTLEFDQMISHMLRDDGLYIANIIDGGTHGHFLRAFVRTVEAVFPYVEVIPSTEGWRTAFRTTFVIVASRQPIDLSSLLQSTAPLSHQELAEYLALEKPLILTDDYVPVDTLLAPVYVDSERM